MTGRGLEMLHMAQAIKTKPTLMWKPVNPSPADAPDRKTCRTRCCLATTDGLLRLDGLNLHSLTPSASIRVLQTCK